MIPRQHQVEGAKWALETIRDHGLAYLSWQERTGKTLTALLTVENSKAKTCLIVTKKKAIDGWTSTLKEWEHTTTFQVINYESIHKVKGSFDFIILDESHHAISSVGRTSKTWKNVSKFTTKKPILYLSATPYAEHLGLIYHQLKLSSWSPFRLDKTFYDWFRRYGISKMTRTPYGLVETYSKYEDDIILDMIEHLFNFKTRSEVGIEHEPQVNVVKIPLLETTKQVINDCIKMEMFILNDIEIPLDSPMKIRTTHYQLEGGTLKTDTGRLFLNSGREKIEYIKANYDESKIAIMAHFIAERELLEKLFPRATILSSDGHAEGVDLHRIDKLIIYSMSFKTSKYTQRLARQANHNRRTEIIVDILVGDRPAIGYDVYHSVAVKKENFDNNSYKRIANDKTK
jgi:hypothetical protein